MHPTIAESLSSLYLNPKEGGMMQNFVSYMNVCL